MKVGYIGKNKRNSETRREIPLPGAHIVTVSRKIWFIDPLTQFGGARNAAPRSRMSFLTNQLGFYNEPDIKKKGIYRFLSNS